MDKAIRLIEYLTRLASLRAKMIRDVGEYERVLWLHKIPKENGCVTQAWGPSDESDSDTWIEIKKSPEPSLSALPSICSDWVKRDSLYRTNEFPELYKTITKQGINPAWNEGSEQPQYINQTLQLEEYPKVRESWNDYFERRWIQ